MQHAKKLSMLTFLTEHAGGAPIDRYPIGDAEYYDILKSVENRQSDIKLTIEFSFSGELETSYTVKSQSMQILNMAPHLLTIRQRTNDKKCYDYAIQ